VSIFTDPCDDTPKYLEVDYTCDGKALALTSDRSGRGQGFFNMLSSNVGLRY
jgi:hypothetical protein